MERLKSLYKDVRGEIEGRIADFRRLWREGVEEDLYSELVFCLLTPQSKARVCWRAVTSLKESGALFNGDYSEVLRHLQGVRFKYTKARRVVSSRWILKHPGGIRGFLEEFKDPFRMREELVRRVEGYGMKEGSHFLRNVGLGEDLSILDRHILKNLSLLGVIEEVPRSMSLKRYLEIEERMREFSRYVGIPLSHLDLLLWYRETREVFK
ncbi:MAG: N-glycosylase/DNA lyase [Thermoplasmata archaeon]|nr:N-glycosylase/DNA lyase [Thermoplasmata archaeon]